MNYIIKGIVVHGDGYGKKLGFPTTNLEVKNQVVPKNGVYAGLAILEEKKYRAGIVIGPGDKVEAHLIGCSGDAYGKIVTLEINKFIREYQNFETEEELILQIKKDIDLC
ncbi:MAG: riboflavin kinase [Candidatus Paceibacterota bacterium]|jgi:riboflavin kinase/FMN adenylyltransferase